MGILTDRDRGDRVLERWPGLSRSEPDDGSDSATGGQGQPRDPGYGQGEGRGG